MSLTGKHIAILGAGRSGRAAAALAMREGATVSVWDTAGPDAFGGMPEGVAVHPNATEEQGGKVFSDILVVSPGIDTYGSYVAEFSENTGEVIGEVELAARFYRGRIVGITGTNGKTTTTELVVRILSHAELGGTACGNYGTPFAEVVLQANQPAVVSLELSSFQLETIRTLHPVVAVWLNFAPDHMDRYPTVEAYRAAKLRIFENQTPEDTAVIRLGEDLPVLSARVVTFSTTDASADWFSEGHTILHGGETWLHMDRDTSLRGLHNAENTMAALAACDALGVPAPVMREALQGYAPPPHRCELIRTLDGVEYLNDSKATNLHALESALRSQTRPVILIAGGKDAERSAGIGRVEDDQAAERAGIEVIVFGSGGARQVPEAFDAGEAHGQLVRFCSMFAPIAVPTLPSVEMSRSTRRQPRPWRPWPCCCTYDGRSRASSARWPGPNALR